MPGKHDSLKNILLVGLFVIACFYAIPNLYSEDPVIQISLAHPGQLVSAEVVAALKATLQKQQLVYRTVDQTAQGVVFRFRSTDQQLSAFDAIKGQLGEAYTVALNLEPATPGWMQRLGAAPMKQGLDLRGGIHFLLEVDVDSVLTRRYDGIMKGVARLLRENKIRYTSIRKLDLQGVEVQFRDQRIEQQALDLLNKDYTTFLISHVAPQDASGLFSIYLKLSPNELSQIRQSTIEQTMGILRNRVNELGIGEAVVQQQGATRIGVDLPGIQDATRAKQILGGTATLAFHLVDQEHDAMAAMQTGIVPFQSKLYHMEGQPVLLKRQVVLSGDAVTSAMSSYDQQTGSPAVHIELGGGGEQFFTKITRENIGKRMAIVYVETKTSVQKKAGTEVRKTHRTERVISVAVIQSALGGSFQITGLSDLQEASNLALLLRAGALPAPIYPIAELTVGPSLGKENIHRGLVSLEVGLGIIVLMMVFYYHFFGLVADIALFLNLIFLSALMSLMGATLTLPGLAGFVLTVGMAIDANVLINERIREELRLGVSPLMAIQAGYDRAFSTILDSNLTTLIVGIVLFAIGSGSVRGFAVILCLGLMTSMLTSITYTRAIVNAVYNRRQVKTLSIGI